MFKFVPYFSIVYFLLQILKTIKQTYQINKQKISKALFGLTQEKIKNKSQFPLDQWKNIALCSYWITITDNYSNCNCLILTQTGFYWSWVKAWFISFRCLIFCLWIKCTWRRAKVQFFMPYEWIQNNSVMNSWNFQEGKACAMLNCRIGAMHTTLQSLTKRDNQNFLRGAGVLIFQLMAIIANSLWCWWSDDCCINKTSSYLTYKFFRRRKQVWINTDFN